jgi:hypothetical protein
MASPTSAAHGSQACTVNTEHTLSGGTFSAQGSYVLALDLKNAANGDVFEVRIYTILDASDNNTAQQAVLASYSNVQADPNKYSIPIPVDGTYTTQIKFTVKQTAGTGRTVYYNIMTL